MHVETRPADYSQREQEQAHVTVLATVVVTEQFHRESPPSGRGCAVSTGSGGRGKGSHPGIGSNIAG